MQRMQKILYIFILIVMLLFSTVTITMAADADANAGNNSYINNNGVRIFPLGCRSRWSGFILYIVDGNANIQSEVKAVVSQTTEPSYNPGASIIYTRLGGGSVDLASEETIIREGGIGGYPPFDSDGNACGGDIRDWMLSQDNGTDYNLYNVLEDYFLSDIPDILSKFVDNNWYLIIEPFFWYGYYYKDEAGEVVFSGDWICGTAPMIAEQENMFNFMYNLDSAYGSPYFKRYTNKNFPNCCRFSRSQFGIDVLIRGGSIKSMPTNDEIINYGYGIMSFWAGELTPEDTIPPADAIEDTEKTVNIGLMPEYYTGNRVNGYDVSHSIPENSTIRNEALAASYYFKELNVGVRAYTRSYSKPVTLYEETVHADGSTTRQTVYSGYINAEASVTFEYLKEVPDIFKFIGMSVNNNVYKYNPAEYIENISFLNCLSVYGSIYNGDTDESPESLTQDSRFVPGNAHFVLPEHDEEAVSAAVEAVINTVSLKKEDRACTNPDCDDGWIDDWEWCEECGGDGKISYINDEICDHCDKGDKRITTQCGPCYGTGLCGTTRCSNCNAQTFETYQICGKCDTEGEPGDYICFNCNGDGYTSKGWIEPWTEYVPDLPCHACDATGYDEEGELCYLCVGAKNAGTPYYHEGTWNYKTCTTCDGTKTVFKCPETDCDGSGSDFKEMLRCSNCGNDETTNECEDCKGKGNVYDIVSCQDCGGDGIITTITVKDCDNCDDGCVDITIKCGTCEGDGIIQAGSHVITDDNRYFTAEEIMSAVREHAEAVAEFISLNSEVRNDRLVVEDNVNIVSFMSDEAVAGADITVSLEGSVFTGRVNSDESAAEYTEESGSADGVVIVEGGDASDSQYSVEACAENAAVPIEITMGAGVDVSPSFGTGSAPTGIVVHYEHALFGYEVEMYAGKAVYGDISEVDNIYNHVLEGYRGAYHNGGDPDDGYHIVVSEYAVEVPTTTPESTTTPVTTTPEQVEITISGATELKTTPAPENVPPINYLDIVDCNFTRQTRPSPQLVDVMTDAEYYLTLDNSYYLILAEDAGDNKHVVKKEMQFPFDVYYEGMYYQTDASGYTEWIEVKAPDRYTDVWDDGVNVADYESNNHWYVAPVYIPSWAKETDSTKDLTYIQVKVTNSPGEEIISNASVQVSGVLYGFTITGINDISQYYKITEGEVIKNLNFNAAVEKLEWRVGTRNRIGGTYLRYLSDGMLTDVAEDYQTLPIRKGSGDGTEAAKTGDGEMSAGTSFSFIIKSISDLTGQDDYIEIIPHFKYLMQDGTIIQDEKLLILYEYSDTRWYVAGSDTEKKVFGELIRDCSNSKDTFSTGIAPNLRLERFNESYYDAADMTSYRYGDWIGYTVEKYNIGLPVEKRINTYRFMNRQHLTSLLGIARIPAELRLYSGEFEQLIINLDKEPYEAISCEDYNRDGIVDGGYDIDRFRCSMQTWYGNYMINQNLYCVNKALYPEFWVDGNAVRPEADGRIMRGGKLIIGFEINAYKNGVKHLTYGDMWQTEGQKRYTVKEYIPDSDDIAKKDSDFPYDKIIYDSLMIDYGDVAVVDVDDKLSDDYWNSGSFIIN